MIRGASSASPTIEVSTAGWQTATIEAITTQTPTVKSVLLRPRVWRPFLPGQHLDVRLTAPDGYEARRSYSIASAPATTADAPATALAEASTVETPLLEDAPSDSGTASESEADASAAAVLEDPPAETDQAA